MIKVILHQGVRKEYLFKGPLKKETLARNLGIDPNAIIIVLGGKVLLNNSEINDGDEVDVYPALSGG